MSVAPRNLTLGVAQSHTRPTKAATLQQLSILAHEAASRSVQLLLFPEAYLGGYPRTCGFGSSIGARTDEGRSQFLQHFEAAIDLGDTPSGAGDAWRDRTLEIKKGIDYRGDGTREELEKIARRSSVFLVVGVIEKAAGSLYCAAVYVCPVLGCIGKRRKVMPTGTERSIWAQGSTSTLRAVSTTLNGIKITLAAAVCWENFMPLLRFSLYSQDVNVYLAPTADARATWLPLLQTIANEGRCFVLSSNQCVERKDLPDWLASEVSADSPVPSTDPTSQSEERPRKRSITTKTSDNHEIVTSTGETDHGTSHSNEKGQSIPRRKSVTTRTLDDHEITWPVANNEYFLPMHEQIAALSSTVIEEEDDVNSSNQATKDSTPEFVCKGGSCIVSPFGTVLAGPLWDTTDSIITAKVDFNDIVRSKLDFDVGGHYSRSDSFELKVRGLNLDPPP